MCKSDSNGFFRPQLLVYGAYSQIPYLATYTIQIMHVLITDGLQCVHACILATVLKILYNSASLLCYYFRLFIHDLCIKIISVHLIDRSFFNYHTAIVYICTYIMTTMYMIMLDNTKNYNIYVHTYIHGHIQDYNKGMVLCITIILLKMLTYVHSGDPLISSKLFMFSISSTLFGPMQAIFL